MSNNTKNLYAEIRDKMTEERKNEIRKKYFDLDVVMKQNEKEKYVDLDVVMKQHEEKLIDLLERLLGTKASRQLIEIFAVMHETQREIILSLYNLDLDIKKRELFLRYLESAQEKESAMFEMSDIHDLDLNNLHYRVIDQVDDYFFEFRKVLSDLDKVCDDFKNNINAAETKKQEMIDISARFEVTLKNFHEVLNNISTNSISKDFGNIFNEVKNNFYNLHIEVLKKFNDIDRA